MYVLIKYGGMAELADATDLKSVGRKVVWVRVPLPPPLRALRPCYQLTFKNGTTGSGRKRYSVVRG